MLLNYPEGIQRETVQKLLPVIEAARKAIDTKTRRSKRNIELEVRFKKSNSESIGLDTWLLFLRALESNSHVFAAKDWEEIIDRSYTIKDQTIRHSRSRSGEESIVKERVAFMDIPVKNCNIVHVARIVFSCENGVQSKVEHVVPSLVRMKLRKSFVYRDMWSVDLTKVWSGANDAEVNAKRDKAFADANRDESSVIADRYEVEIELVDADAYFSSESRTDEYIALSFLMKIVGFLPPGAFV